MTCVSRLLTNDISPSQSMNYRLLFVPKTTPALPHVVCQYSPAVPVIQTKKPGIWCNLIAWTRIQVSKDS